MAKTGQIWWSDIDEGSVEMSDQQGSLYEAGLEANKRLPKGEITEVTIRCPTIRSWHLQSLATTLPTITSLLLLHEEEIEEDVFPSLSLFPRLTSIVIGAGRQALRSSQLQALLASTSLEELHLGTLEQVDGLLAPLLEQKRIKTLSLSAFEGPMSILRDVAKMTWLDTFALAFERNFTAEGWQCLSEMSSLPSLSLYFFGGDVVIDEEEDTEETEETEETHLLAEGIDFSFLHTMHNLRSLEIESFSLSAQQTKQIVSLAPRLHELHIEDCFLAKDALEAFADLTELRTLSLRYCEAETSVDWGCLERLFLLEDFSFSSEELPKPLLHALVKINSLRQVSLELELLEEKERLQIEQGFGPQVQVTLDVIGEESE